MPLYEYRCEPCDRTFETLIRSSGDQPHCPQCGNVDVDKQLSVPAAAHTANGRAGRCRWPDQHQIHRPSAAAGHNAAQECVRGLVERLAYPQN